MICCVLVFVTVMVYFLSCLLRALLCLLGWFVVFDYGLCVVCYLLVYFLLVWFVWLFGLFCFVWLLLGLFGCCLLCLLFYVC